MCMSGTAHLVSSGYRALQKSMPLSGLLLYQAEVRLRYSSVRFGPLSPRPLTQMCLLHSRRVGPVTPAPKVSPYSGVAISLMDPPVL